MAMIQRANEKAKVSNKSRSSTRDQNKVKLELKTEELAVWLRKASQVVSGELCYRPIIDGAEQATQKSRRLLKNVTVFTDFSKMMDQLEDAIRSVKWLIRISSGSHSSIRESILPRVAPPPIDESKRSHILKQMAILQTGTGSLIERSDAAFSLVLLVLNCYQSQERLRHGGRLLQFIELWNSTREPQYIWELFLLIEEWNSKGDPRYVRKLLELIEGWNSEGDPHRVGKFIVEEGGVKALLKLLRDGDARGQVNAAIAIGMLGHDMESVQHMVQAGVCSVFVKILREGPMNVQAVVAWAVSQHAQNFPKWQHNFLLHKVIYLLVDHLAFQTIPKHYNDAPSKAISIHDVVMMSTNFNASNNVLENDAHNNLVVKYVGDPCQEHAFRAYLKEMAAKALWKLAEGNLSICRSIVQSRALLCFALLLKEGAYNVKYNCAMALMKISSVAEEDVVTKRVGFKPNSHFFKILVEQMLVMIKLARSEIFVPCIRTSGHLAVLLRAKGVQVVEELVKLLRTVSLPSLFQPEINDLRTIGWGDSNLICEEEWQLRSDIFDGIPSCQKMLPWIMEYSHLKDVCEEVLISLTKFASSDHYLHLKHSEEIIRAGGVEPLTKLVSSDDDQFLQIPALIVLCYVALDVPRHEELKKYKVINVLEQALRQPMLVKNEVLQKLLPDAIAKVKPQHHHDIFAS